MKTAIASLKIFVLLGLVFLAIGQTSARNNSVLSNPESAQRNEALGLEPAHAGLVKKSRPNLKMAATSASGSATQLRNVLLIPDSTNDRVMVFSAVTGNLINESFIPSDSDNLSFPIQAILSASGQSILVSDQVGDVVLEYDLSGQFIGVFAPEGGVNTDIIDNIRGIVLRDNGNLLVTVGNGENADAIAEFDTQGNYIGNFIERNAGGLDSPFGILKWGTDFLVSAIDSNNLLNFSKTGEFQFELAPVDGFAEQLALARNGNILVANFLGSQEGIIELTPEGTVVGISDPAEIGGYRGIFELPNRHYLVTNGGGVHEIDRNGNLIETKISGVSARFIEPIGIESDELCLPIKAANGRIAVICL